MNLKLAEAIMHDYGKFLEISHGGLMGLFSTEIPESLLPYPKEKIEEALVNMANFFRENETIKRNIEACLASLECYIEDKKALESFSKKMKNKEFMEKFLKWRKNRQEKLLKELEIRLNIKNCERKN
jgi:lipoate-protein ligase A